MRGEGGEWGERKNEAERERWIGEDERRGKEGRRERGREEERRRERERKGDGGYGGGPGVIFEQC